MSTGATIETVGARREVRPYALDLERARRAARRRGTWLIIGWWLAAIAVACAWDRAAWLMTTRAGAPVLQWLEDSIAWANIKTALGGIARLSLGAIGDLLTSMVYGATYVFGRIWPWIGLALYLIFRHWAGTDGAKVKDGLRRGTMVFLVPAMAGLAAEALKLVTRRMRPEHGDGLWVFKPWPRAGVTEPEFWNVSGLGLASSHAAVAVGGALAAGVVLPRLRPVLWVLAALCMAGRAAVGAHFMSDVVVGAALGYAAFKMVYAWDRRNNGGMGLKDSQAHGL